MKAMLLALAGLAPPASAAPSGTPMAWAAATSPGRSRGGWRAAITSCRR